MNASGNNHIPAVRRIVVWETEDHWGNKKQLRNQKDAYLMSAKTLVFKAWVRHPTWPAGLNKDGWQAFEAHWPPERIQRLADALWRRDEKAECDQKKSL